MSCKHVFDMLVKQRVLAKQLLTKRGGWGTDCLKTIRLWNVSSEHLNCDGDVTELRRNRNSMQLYLVDVHCTSTTQESQLKVVLWWAKYGEEIKAVLLKKRYPAGYVTAFKTGQISLIRHRGGRRQCLTGVTVFWSWTSTEAKPSEALTSLQVFSLCSLQQHSQLSLPLLCWKGHRRHFLLMSPFSTFSVLSGEKDQDVLGTIKPPSFL